MIEASKGLHEGGPKNTAPPVPGAITRSSEHIFNKRTEGIESLSRIGPHWPRIASRIGNGDLQLKKTSPRYIDFLRSRRTFQGPSLPHRHGGHPHTGESIAARADYWGAFPNISVDACSSLTGQELTSGPRHRPSQRAGQQPLSTRWGFRRLQTKSRWIGLATGSRFSNRWLLQPSATS